MTMGERSTRRPYATSNEYDEQHKASGRHFHIQGLNIDVACIEGKKETHSAHFKQIIRKPYLNPKKSCKQRKRANAMPSNRAERYAKQKPAKHAAAAARKLATKKSIHMPTLEEKHTEKAIWVVYQKYRTTIVLTLAMLVLIASNKDPDLCLFLPFDRR